MNAAISRPATLLLLGSFTAAWMLHVDHVPWWCSAAAAIAVLWHTLICFGKLSAPGSVLRTSFMLLLVAATAISFRSFSGLAAGSALLLCMGAAKLLEIRAGRDAVVMVLTSLVLLLAACLDRQSLTRLPLYAITGWLCVAALAAQGSTREARSSRQALALSGRSLLYAIPLAALCFVFVPRLPGALWSLPANNGAQSGLGDEMNPGSISELTLSDAPAFRVRFEGPAPAPADRYWRGPVLHDFDGSNWRRLRGQFAQEQTVEERSSRIRYRVMLEPHQRNYLPALDSPRELSGQRHFRQFDSQLLSIRPVTTAITYDAISVLHLQATSQLSNLGRRLDTRLPENRNPRSVALAHQLRSEAGDDAAYTQRVLRYFRESGFTYSLTPPRLDYDSVDDLIFNTRLGFCGHFASAYVTLMRAAGVPARVVTGYLGGEWNAIGGYYLVRQADAHAWAEVWLDGTGWTRIDPTAVVAPGRIERSLRDLLPDSGSASARIMNAAGWLRDIAARWDAANSWWQERVINFNLNAQLNLLAKLGLHDVDYRHMAGFLLAGGLLWATLTAWWLAQQHRGPRLPAAGQRWADFQAHIRKNGSAVSAADPPLALAQRAAALWPHCTDEICAFTDCYLALRYGRNSGDGNRDMDLRRLNELWRQLERATAARHPAQTAPTARESTHARSR
jgi:protein-glutamine gamma-glutamyltransferase